MAASPLYILLHSWDANFRDRRFLFDIAVNIAVYIPLGMSAYLAMRRYNSRVLRVVAPVLLGAILSAAVEMAQLFTPHRICSTVDLIDNIIGSVLGVVAGVVFTRIVDVPVEGPDFHVRNRSAVALLFCWVASLLFPLYPVLWLPVWSAKIATFLRTPLSPIPALLSAAEWFAVGRLLIAAGARLRWLFVLLLLVPVQFAIVNHNPGVSEFVGAAVAGALFFFIGERRGVDRFAGVALLVAMTLRGLAPFHFEGPVQTFSWIPFAGLLGADRQNAFPILLGKLFDYGAIIWLLGRAGLGNLRATAMVTVVLVGIEMLQTRIPGHVAEINDPLLAVLICLGFVVLERG